MRGHSMATAVQCELTANVLQTRPPKSLDTVRGLCHDLRQPLAAIRLLAGSEGVDVAELSYRCVQRARPTATCRIAFFGCDNASTAATPVALGRAITCVLDNAVRAAGPGGQVTVDVTATDVEITIRVIDDGPGLGKVPRNNSLGLTITRALVSACGGAFELIPGAESGMVARIALPAMSSEEMAS